MKKYLLSSILSVALLSNTFAQTTEKEDALKKQSSQEVEGWKKGGLTSLTFNQVSLTNWAAGGSNAIATNAFFNVFANYKKGSITWDNNLDLAYGLVRQGNKNAPWLKSDDRIDFTSKAGKLAGKNWYYAGLLNFRSQFAPGYQTADKLIKISDFLAPAYLLAALGFDYKPNAYFSAFIAPVTSKTTLVYDQKLADAGAFGVDKAIYDLNGSMQTPGKNIREEVGGYVKIMFQKDLFKNVNFQTKADFFSNYLNNPQNIDINWQTMLGLKVNQYISATVGTHLIYDDDIMIAIDKNDDGITDGAGPRTQFKQFLNVGFSYKF